MGWLSFFTDMTKGILNKCRVPLPGANLSFEANWCQKRISLPKLQDLQRSNASFAFKPSTIGTVLVEEIKNTIINLTVSATIAAMKQIFEIISAGASFDSDYFKQNQFIPDTIPPWTTGGYLPPDYQKQLRTSEIVTGKQFQKFASSQRWLQTLKN